MMTACPTAAFTSRSRIKTYGDFSDEELLSSISDGTEARWDESWLVQTDKAWDPIHRCLTDGRLEYENGSDPLRLCILGGRQLHKGDDYVVSLKDPSQCARISTAITAIEKAWLRNRYFAISFEDPGRTLPRPAGVVRAFPRVQHTALGFTHDPARRPATR